MFGSASSLVFVGVLLLFVLIEAGRSGTVVGKEQQQTPMARSLRFNFAFRSGGSDVVVVFCSPPINESVSFVVFYVANRIDSCCNNNNFLQAPGNDKPQEDDDHEDHDQECDPPQETLDRYRRLYHHPSEERRVTQNNGHHRYDHRLQRPQHNTNHRGYLLLQDESSPKQSLATIETACHPSSGNNREFICPVPSIASLMPNFTADNYFGKYFPVRMQQEFGSCKKGQFLCYGVMVNGQAVPFHDQKFVAEKTRFFLNYYPDPVVTSINFTHPNLISVAGNGFVMPGVQELYRKPKFELSANFPSINQSFPIKCNSTYFQSPPNNGFTCLFEKSQLQSKCFISSSNATISLRYGNWSHVRQIDGFLDIVCYKHVGTETEEEEADEAVPLTLILSVTVSGSVLVLILIVLLFYLPRTSFCLKMKCLQIMLPNAMESTGNNYTLEMQRHFSLPPQMAAHLAPYKINRKRLVLTGEDLGEGFYGVVKSATLFQSAQRKRKRQSTESDSTEQPLLLGRKVAVKTLQEWSNQETLKEFFEEAMLTFSLNHDNVLAAIGFVREIESGGPPGIVFSLMDNGDLLKFVRTNEEFNNDMLLNFAWQIAKGMSYLTSLKLVHRDLAARNCLLNHEMSGLTKQLVVKVSDFGLCRCLDDTNYEYNTPEYKIAKPRPMAFRYLAPECLKNWAFSEKSDVWAYGVVLWEMGSRGQKPYGHLKSDIDEVAPYVRDQNGHPEQTPEMSDELYELMSSCWREHTTERPNFDELVNATKGMLDQQQNYCDPSCHIVMHCSSDTP